MPEDRAIAPETLELHQRRAAAQMRAKVGVGELNDHLNTLAAMAVSGDRQAQELARGFLEALDGLRSAQSGIVKASGRVRD